MLACLSVTGCGDDHELPEAEGGEGTSSEPVESSTGGAEEIEGDETTTDEMDTEEGDELDEPPILLDVGSVPDVPEDNHCGVLTAEPDANITASDLIVAVDTDGSTPEGVAAVRDHLSSFVQYIEDAGIDTRVVLIASGPTSFDGCIDAPLGSGGCPASDDNEPRFLHVDHRVEGHNAYDQILKTFPLWSHVMRPDATKQILIVSDDDASKTWERFAAEFEKLDPTHLGFTQHALVNATSCDGPQQVGREYIELAADQLGAVADLCAQDFVPAFSKLADAVIERSIACEYALPDSGSSALALETTELRIDFGEGLEPLEALTECAPFEDGFLVDEASVVLCPNTCEKLRRTEQPRLELAVAVECEP